MNTEITFSSEFGATNITQMIMAIVLVCHMFLSLFLILKILVTGNTRIFGITRMCFHMSHQIVLLSKVFFAMITHKTWGLLLMARLYLFRYGNVQKGPVHCINVNKVVFHIKIFSHGIFLPKQEDIIKYTWHLELKIAVGEYFDHMMCRTWQLKPFEVVFVNKIVYLNLFYKMLLRGMWIVAPSDQD